MNKYLRHYVRVFKISLMSEMTDRVNFLIWSAVHSLTLLMFIAFFSIVFSQVGEINGWSQFQVLLVVGIGTLVGGLGSITFFSFMYDHPRDIQNGDFDFKLTKPMDAHFQAAFASVDMDDFIVVPNSILLIIYSLNRLAVNNLGINVIVFLGLLVSSMIILFSILTLFMSLSFKYIRIDSIMQFYWSIVNTTKNPVKAYKTTSIFLSALFLPIILISSIPAEVLFGRLEWNWILGSVVTAVLLLIVSRRVFQNGLKNYSSASS